MIKLIRNLTLFFGLYVVSQILLNSILPKPPEIDESTPSGINANINELQEISMDLARTNPLEKVRIKTDGLGFYNDKYCKTPKVVLIGDSFLKARKVGSQHSYSSLLNQIFGDCYVYNITSRFGSNINTYDLLIKDSLLNRPQTIIAQIIERNLNSWITFGLKEDKILDANEIVGYKKLGFFKFRYQDLIKSMIPNPSHIIKGKRIYFMKENLSAPKLQAIVDHLVVVQNELKKRGTKIYFLVAPDKESMYPDLFKNPPNQTPAVKKFEIRGERNGLNVIRTYDLLFQSNLESPIYFDQDTHWNLNGHKLVVSIIEDVINSQ